MATNLLVKCLTQLVVRLNSYTRQLAPWVNGGHTKKI